MRLFVGIALSDETEQALASYVSGLSEVFARLRWSTPQQWHVTLQFLGEADDARYVCIVDQLRTVRASSVEIHLAEPGFFERAGVFHVAVQATKTLVALHYQVEQVLQRCGFEPEARPYSPHITLARNKGRGPLPDFKRLKQAIHEKPVPILSGFTSQEFLLYQSSTEPSGSRYEVRERFPLM
ncbi:MAG TPA: RNA 2',3'-cyclic phosphodiesterase [Pseudacidobacterium sp.]|nr:RNA 2',3'-cyclic phosphodiesterase [Pseudacidobacterium sp.]